MLLRNQCHKALIRHSARDKELDSSRGTLRVIRNIPTIQKGTFKNSVHTTPRALCQTDSFQSICKNRISAMRFDCQDILIRYTLDKTAGVTY